MDTVVFSEVKAACLAVSTLSTQLEEIIKNKLKEVLGKYYKDSERSYFVRGVNTKQYTLLLENGPLYISTNIESIKEYSKRTKAKDVKYKKIKFKL